MARVRFTDDFDYRPRFGVTIAYKKGMEETVRRECADEAIAKGVAKEINPPRRERKAKAKAGKGTLVQATKEKVGPDGWVQHEKVGQPVWQPEPPLSPEEGNDAGSQ
ncbi:hypothetical protein [Oryzicola mucosus]|uniref:Uncharacterized protein n=1 Tax=Oryzicola mucosus TaxID=2767425 RepID=A0A8J6PK33_9HYPH|nr:hypothetical protein [Oryzicola mucosus]MBD0416509.1 hypothetical protein [Oryzicola mucosus]